MSDRLDDWFVREILPHEAALTRFLTRRWPRRAEVPDIRQEAYMRVYEAAMKSRPRTAKTFLFITARNLMADRARRRRIVSIDAVRDVDALNVSIDEVSPEARLTAYEELRRLAQAFDALPAKCRRVMWLRRVEELSQRQVADQLGISEKTVEKHVARGVQLLADFLYGDANGIPAPRNMTSLEASAHGKQQED